MLDEAEKEGRGDWEGERMGGREVRVVSGLTWEKEGMCTEDL